MQRLFPDNLPGLDLQSVYSVPELNFPTTGIPLANGGRRSYVYFNMVASVDGKAVSASGNAEGLGSPTDRFLMHRLRAAADAVLIGAETFRRDPFVPQVSPEAATERHRYFPDAPQPLGIVISGDGNLPLDKKFFDRANAANRLVVLGQAATSQKEAAFQPFARTVRAPDREGGRPDESWLLDYLYRELGVRRLLCEGGPSLNFSFISRGLGDELFWTLAPKLVGGSTNRTILAGPGPGFPLDRMPRLNLISLYEQTNELFFRYKINP
jgi:2,5-diamino-6-(ribosylamino)-4(3H)-pyrimidinone 5'-phosphate reductase